MDRLVIKGTINVDTGMHIGGSDSFSAIGAIDSPVIRDALTGLPIIPGSSLKGKLRTLLASQFTQSYKTAKTNYNDDDEKVTRLFGSSDPVKNSRLLFSDAIISNFEELKKLGVISTTEAKTENSIDRLSLRANPRTIERVIRGSRFDIEIIYILENEEEFEEDIKNLALAFKLLHHDYLGGHGSRGYGRVCFVEPSVESVLGEADEAAKLAETILGA